MVRLAADNLRFSPLSLVEGEVGGRSSPGEGASATPLALAGRGPGEGGSGTGILPVTPLALSSPTPWATATTVAFGSPTPTSSFLPHPSASVTAVPSMVETPSPLSHMHTENSQPALQRYYYHANRLYNVCALTNAQGNVVERYQYNAYGLCTTFNANYELPLAFSRFGNPFTFTGRELDPEIEAMHYRSRIYLLRLGLFGQQDPIGYLGGINLYEYCKSLPTDSLDPSGENWVKWVGGGIVGAAVVIGSAWAYLTGYFDSESLQEIKPEILTNNDLCELLKRERIARQKLRAYSDTGGDKSWPLFEAWMQKQGLAVIGQKGGLQGGLVGPALNYSEGMQAAIRLFESNRWNRNAEATKHPNPISYKQGIAGKEVWMKQWLAAENSRIEIVIDELEKEIKRRCIKCP